MYRRISIGVWLKVNNKLIGFIEIFTASMPFSIAREWLAFFVKFRRKRIYVTIGATAIAFATITIRTGKAAINDSFKNPLPVIFSRKNVP